MELRAVRLLAYDGNMKAVKATYHKGRVTLSEKPSEEGPVDVLVVFPEAGDDLWQEILEEHKPRSSFVKFAEKCRQEIARGKAKPLKLDELWLV